MDFRCNRVIQLTTANFFLHYETFVMVLFDYCSQFRPLSSEPVSPDIRGEVGISKAGPTNDETRGFSAVSGEEPCKTARHSCLRILQNTCVDKLSLWGVLANTPQPWK